MAQSKKSSSTKKSTAAKKTNSKTSTAKKSSTRKAPESAAPPPPPAPPIRREITALIFLFLAVFLIISHYNKDGSFIVFFANLIKGLIGWGFWVMVPAFVVAAVILGFHKGYPVTLRAVCALLIPVFVSATGHLLTRNLPPAGFDVQLMVGYLFEHGQVMDGGGVLGGLIAIALGNSLSLYGALPVLAVILVFCIIKAFKFNVSGAVTKARERSHVKYDPSMYVVNKFSDKDEDIVEPVMLGNSPETVISKSSSRTAKQPRKIERIERDSYSMMDIPLFEEDEEEFTFLRESKYKNQDTPIKRGSDAVRPSRLRSAAPIIIEEADDSFFSSNDLGAKKAVAAKEEPPKAEIKSVHQETGSFAQTRKRTRVRNNENDISAEEAARLAGVDVDELRSTVDELMKPVAVTAEISDPPKKRMSKSELAKETQAMAMAISQNIDGETGDYKYPTVDLLRCGEGGNIDAREEIQLNRDRLEGALHSFGINAAIVDVTHGPTVTRYDIELEQGVKLARVTNLAGDLALALGVINVRIAPIPDKISTVGIEVPNKIVSTVYLRDIIDSSKFKNAKSKLSFSLGKDIGGDCVVGNIAKMPHLLIAGTTGSGKSVCMNSLILSLLFKARPDEVKLIMIDPKMVELGIYNGIPHLYVPVVTDPKKAAGALQWSVVEMLKRYRLFSEVGVRDLESYNKHCKANGEESLPQVVIVIDELADLMLVASKEVEESICRVAQMGRAAGMHLVIATQRPSADVITGLMKANIPSRIAFAVSSALESRIILDQAGAEKLVGMGDMLFSPVGAGKPVRIQGAFVSDEERENVIQFIKEDSAPGETNDELQQFMDKASEGKDASEPSGKAARDDSPSNSFDDMLPQAVEAVLEAGSCSVSMLQRRVKLGYSRAARIVDQMEELGIVGPYEGAKPRKLVIDREGWAALAAQLGYAVDPVNTAAEISDAANGAAADYDEI